jgi:hypothetical protein
MGERERDIIYIYIALYVVAPRRGSMMILQGEVIVKEITK